MKPAVLLFLDADGVLNALPGRDVPTRRPWAGYRRTEAVADGHTFPIAYDPVAVHRLNALAAAGLAACVTSRPSSSPRSRTSA